MKILCYKRASSQQSRLPSLPNDFQSRVSCCRSGWRSTWYGRGPAPIDHEYGPAPIGHEDWTHTCDAQDID